MVWNAPPSINLPRFKHYREKEEARFEPVRFRKVQRKPMVPQTEVKMIRTVGGKYENGERWNLEALKTYYLDQDKADEFIIKGYCTGELSRMYSEGEQAHMRSTVQNIDMPQVIGADKRNG